MLGKGGSMTQRDNHHAIIIPSGFVTGDVIVVMLLIGAVLGVWSLGEYPAFLMPFALAIIIVIWLALNGERVLRGRPFLKLSEEGFIDSRLDEAVTLPWQRMREPKLEWHRVDLGEGSAQQAFFTFFLDAPANTGDADMVQPKLCTYVNRSRAMIGIRATAQGEYPLKVLVPLEYFRMRPEAISTMLVARVETAQNASPQLGERLGARNETA